MPLWSPEIIMLKHTWVDQLVAQPHIGLPSLCLYHPLVSVLISCRRVLKEQVSNWVYSEILLLLFGKQRLSVTGWWKLFDVIFLLLCLMAGSEVAISKWYLSERNANKTFEVGQGNLKLLYTGNEGKLTSYINSRNSVFHFQIS